MILNMCDAPALYHSARLLLIPLRLPSSNDATIFAYFKGKGEKTNNSNAGN